MPSSSYKSRLAAGLCYRCGKKRAKHSKMLCKKHLIAAKERSVAYQKRNQDIGLCRECPRPRGLSSSYCDKHMLAHREYGRERIGYQGTKRGRLALAVGG